MVTLYIKCFSLTFCYLKDVLEECEKLRETISAKDKKLARMNKAFGNKVKSMYFCLQFSLFFYSFSAFL